MFVVPPMLILLAYSSGKAWVGPLVDSYGGPNACADVGNHVGTLEQCQALCVANAKCNAMNWGLEPQGCSLRNCAPSQLQPTGGVIADCHAYYCNVSRADDFCVATPSAAAVLLRSAFSNSMVLQANDASLSGTVQGYPGHRVVVTLDGATVIGTGFVDVDGAFTVNLGAQKTSAIEHTLTISASNVSSTGGTVMITPAVLTGVLFGEVFLCSGQSNMGLAVEQANNATAEIAAAKW